MATLEERLANIQLSIDTLPDDETKNGFQDRKNAITEENQTDLDTLETDIKAAAGNLGGRRRKYSRRGRRSAKKRGTQRKQKRRQRRGSRRAY